MEKRSLCLAILNFLGKIVKLVYLKIMVKKEECASGTWSSESDSC